MFKLLLTTAPLLATLVHAVPRPNIQQIAQFYEKEISPAKHSATISLAKATSTAEPVNIELPFDSHGIEAIKEALEGLPEMQSTVSVSPTASEEISVIDEPSATIELTALIESSVVDGPTATAEPSPTVEVSESLRPTMFDSPSVILEPAPTDDTLSMLGKRAEPSAVSDAELAHLADVMEKSQAIATAVQETPVTVPTDHSGAFVEGAAALINEVLKQMDLPLSTHDKPSSLDDSSLSAEATTMSTVVGTPLASAVPEASDAPTAEDDAISLLGKRDEPAANPTTLATVVQAATARATPDTTAIAIPAEAEASGPVATDEPISSALDTRAVGRKNVLYFTNWGIYGANYQPQQLPADQVTHLLYAFADIASDGTVKSSDSYSDIEKHYSTDSWNDVGKNAYGCIKQFYILKKKNRKLKTMLSIGGWTWSYKFPPVAASAAGRKQFASSAVKLMADWGFDGIDIDWEYPANNKEASDYVLLLKEVRSALDKFSSSNKLNYRFQITVATPAGPAHYKQMNLKGMNPYVDAWHLMAYDYAGSWDTTTGYQSNIYNSKSYPKATKFNTDQAVTDYMKAGIPASKIILGLPLYGRSFANAKNVGQTYSGVGGGSLQPGVYNYKDLPRPGARIWQDKPAGSIYSWNSATKEMVTFDNVLSAGWKADYLLKKSLGGAVFWEASGDKTGGNSLVRTLAKRMGSLDSTQNNLKYPTSQYDNIRKNTP